MKLKFAVFLFSQLFLFFAAFSQQKQFKALLVTTTRGWHHESLHYGVIAIKELAVKNFFKSAFDTPLAKIHLYVRDADEVQHERISCIEEFVMRQGTHKITMLIRDEIEFSQFYKNVSDFKSILEILIQDFPAAMYYLS